MINKSIRTDSPTISREDAYERFASEFHRRLGQEATADQLIYCCWPESFGSTCGPFPGVGGQTVTTFRMEAWELGGWAVVFCNGKFVRFSEFLIGATWGKR